MARAHEQSALKQYQCIAAEHCGEEKCLLLRSSCCVVALGDKDGLG